MSGECEKCQSILDRDDKECMTCLIEESKNLIYYGTQELADELEKTYWKQDEDLATIPIPPLPENVTKYYDCHLLHSKIPKTTGNKVWDKHSKEWKHEIVYICKEGCN